MKKAQYKFTCDLCESSIVDPEIPWCELSLEERQLDRSWIERNVCPSCAEKIYLWVLSTKHNNKK
jgi:hypothetical protein